jgi:hypothetical protein
MSEVTPIRPDVPASEALKGKRRAPRGPTIPIRAMDEALLDQRIVLFQAMGIVRMASKTIQRDASHSADAWTALDGAYELLSGIADRLECADAMLSDEVPERGVY